MSETQTKCVKKNREIRIERFGDQLYHNKTWSSILAIYDIKDRENNRNEEERISNFRFFRSKEHISERKT